MSRDNFGDLLAFSLLHGNGTPKNLAASRDALHGTWFPFGNAMMAPTGIFCLLCK